MTPLQDWIVEILGRDDVKSASVQELVRMAAGTEILGGTSRPGREVVAALDMLRRAGKVEQVEQPPLPPDTDAPEPLYKLAEIESDADAFLMGTETAIEDLLARHGILTYQQIRGGLPVVPRGRVVGATLARMVDAGRVVKREDSVSPTVFALAVSRPPRDVTVTAAEGGPIRYALACRRVEPTLAEVKRFVAHCEIEGVPETAPIRIVTQPFGVPDRWNATRTDVTTLQALSTRTPGAK